jgi:rieske iron-sulfur protein
VSRPIRRRDLLQAGIGLGVGLHVQSSAAAGQDDLASVRPREGDLLVRAQDPGGPPLTPGDIQPGGMPTVAWPMDPRDRTVRSGSRFNQLLLVRLEADKLTAETRSRAAEGVVAYTVICTHSGCDVDDWLPQEQLLSCSCHASMFDPKDGARVIDGPAPRGLPALPLRVVDGRLVVAGPFTARVGFEPGNEAALQIAE